MDMIRRLMPSIHNSSGNQSHKRCTGCSGNAESDSLLPEIDFQHYTALIYFWGQKPNTGNLFSILQARVELSTSSTIVSLFSQDSAARTFSYPYIITTIPKTAYMKVVFVE